MTIIIDTHIFLWLLNDPSCIKPKYMEHIENTANQLFLSSMSVAELMIKSRLVSLVSILIFWKGKKYGD